MQDAVRVRFAKRVGDLDGDTERLAELEVPRPRRISSVSPSTYCMAMKSWPSASPTS